MSEENELTEQFRLNYNVLVDNITTNKKNTSTLYELISVNRNLLKLMDGLNTAFQSLIKELRFLKNSFKQTIFDLASILKFGEFARLEKQPVAHKFDFEPPAIVWNQFEKLDELDEFTRLYKEFLDNRTFAKRFKKKDLFKDKDKDTTDEKLSGYLKRITDVPSKWQDWQKLERDKEGRITGAPKGWQKLGKALKPLAALPKEFYKLGKSMTKMALITQPLMNFFQSLLEPFDILGDIMGAFGSALGAQLIPKIQTMVKSMVNVFPLLEMIIPLIFEGIAAIATWIGYSTDWTKHLGDSNDATMELAGSIPVLNGGLESANVYSDNLEDSLTELTSELNLSNQSVMNFSLDPISGELNNLKNDIEAYTIDTSNFDNFIDHLQNRVDGLEAGEDEGVSEAGGALGGAAIGGTLGSAVGPVGTVAGAGLGGLIGWLVGKFD